MDFEGIMQSCKTEEQIRCVLKTKNLFQAVEKNGGLGFTDFLDPAVAYLLEKEQNKEEIGFLFSGGYPDGERKMLCLFSKEYETLFTEKIAFPIALLRIPKNKFFTLRHRDILGSFMGMGIKREKMGDILLEEDGAYIFVTEDIKEYLLTNLDRIGKNKVKIEEVKKDEDHLFQQNKGKSVSAVLTSLRLDNVISKGMGLSRGESKSMVEAGKVKLNFLEESRPDSIVEEGQIISVRGVGRLRIEELTGLTKKGSYKLNMIRYK